MFNRKKYFSHCTLFVTMLIAIKHSEMEMEIINKNNTNQEEKRMEMHSKAEEID